MMTTARQRKRRAVRVAEHVAFLLFCLIALRTGTRATDGLKFPTDLDFHRDMAYAETVLDGRFGQDPAYSGEKLWYNPLVPGIAALASKVSGAPMNVVYARAGAQLNILTPIAFYIMVWTSFGSSAAVAAGAAFLFLLAGNEPGWVSATYSPWLYPACFVQALFYASMAWIPRWRGAPGLRSSIFMGVLLGLVFLGHTAPAVVLFGVMVACVLANRQRRIYKGFLISCLIASLVALPLLLSIGFHYRFQVRNEDPMRWTYGPATLAEVGDLVHTDMLTPAFIFVLLGFGVCLRLRRRSCLPLGSWAALSVVLIAYGYLGEFLKRRAGDLPMLLPSFHFLLYARAARAVLFGLGMAGSVWWIVRVARRSWHRVFRGGVQERHAWALAARVLLVVAMAGWVAASIPWYEGRSDFVDQRALSVEQEARTDAWDAYLWLRSHAAPDDVVLAGSDESLEVASMATRRVVAVPNYFSNPFVDLQAREAARARMFGALRALEWAAFLEEAAAFNVRWVLVNAHFARRLDKAQCPVLVAAFSRESVMVYRVQTP